MKTERLDMPKFSHIDTYLQLAKEFFYFLNISELDRCFKTIKQSDSNIALYFTYRYYLVKNDEHNAESIWNRIKQVEVSSPEEHRYLNFIHALKLIKDKDYKSAEMKLFHLAMDEEVSEYFYLEEVFYQLAFIEARFKHNYEKSNVYAKKALTLFNQKMNFYFSVTIMLMLTRNYALLNQNDEVQEHIDVLKYNKNISQMFPDKVLFLYYYIGYMYDQQENFSNALEFYEKSIAQPTVISKEQYAKMYFDYCFFLYKKLNRKCLTEFEYLLDLVKEINHETGEFLTTYFILELQGKDREAIAHLREKCYILEDAEILPSLKQLLKGKLKGNQ